jgi:NitT/TauT family transport system ATP-binding protein
LPLEIRKGDGARSPESLIQLVGLESFEAKLPKELSGGMQHRVALARALTFNPDVLLMDEPFAALDELTRGTLNIELLRICSQVSITVLFVTHSIAEAVFLSDRIVVLTPRPGSINDIVSVPFPRPRDHNIRRLPDFRDLVECVESKIL